MRYSFVSLHVPTFRLPAWLRKCRLYTRILLICLPILALIMAGVFFGTSRSVESLINASTARNLRIQTHAIGFAIAQSLMETRNQLLVLAAGAMNKADMMQRMQFRSRVRDIRYREVAFVGADPKDRYLLLNYNGEIISIPNDQADSLQNSPFHTHGRLKRPDEVIISAPTEVIYPMMPTADRVQNQITLHVIRFSTPIFHQDGSFSGILTLSLDLNSLRTTISTFATEGSKDRDDTPGKVRTLFIDKEGWMIFQGEESAEPESPLRLDDVRAGFRGEFGRAGFSGAFRPGAEYYGYWTMVNEVQHARPGQIARWEGESWNEGNQALETASYAPINYQAFSDGPSEIVGGIVVLDASFAQTRTGGRLLSIYVWSFCLAISLLALVIWIMTRSLVIPLKDLNGEVQEEGEKSLVEKLPVREEPKEVANLRDSINTLLDRLTFLELDRDRSDHLTQARLQREKYTSLPKDFLPPSDGIIGKSHEILSLKMNIARAASVQEDVLVVGETGTGKELVSRAIHLQSSRRDGPFITINCGALDEGLLMDTLFGHVKGAYTEARQPRKGAFLAAEGGTLMLDEIGTASARVQQALLRALSDRCIHPLGSDEFVKFNTRVIAATNADMREEVRAGKFREDLYFRLAVISIPTPPLRQHKEDIPYMVVAFLKEGLARIGAENRPLPDISRGAMSQLMHYHWPGNVRELRNCIFRTLAFCENDMIQQRHLRLGTESSQRAGSGELREHSPTARVLAADKPHSDRATPDARDITPAQEKNGSTSRQQNGNRTPEADPVWLGSDFAGQTEKKALRQERNGGERRLHLPQKYRSMKYPKFWPTAHPGISGRTR